MMAILVCEKCGHEFEVNLSQFKSLDEVEAYINSKFLTEDNLCPLCHSKGYVDSCEGE